MCLEVSDERAVGFNNDLVFVTIIHYCSLLVPGMKLERDKGERLRV